MEYWKLQDEALCRTLWRRDCGPVVRQTADLMTLDKNAWTPTQSILEHWRTLRCHGPSESSDTS